MLKRYLKSSKQRRMSGLKHQRGFNLLELMFTVAITGVIMGIGVPSMTTMSQNGRITGQSNDLLGTLSGARMKALEFQTQVTVCKTSNGSSCNTSAAWQDGWIMFVDLDANGVRDTSTEELLLVRANLAGNNTLSSVAFDDFIAFEPSGITVGSDANNGFFQLRDSRGVTNARDVRVSRIGSSCVAHAGAVC